MEEEERLDILMKASGFAGKADALDQVICAIPSSLCSKMINDVYTIGLGCSCTT